jgi:hypothetical protein
MLHLPEQLGLVGYPFCTALLRLTIRFSSLHQYFNGWLQGKNAYALHLGKYFNLDVCPDKN